MKRLALLVFLTAGALWGTVLGSYLVATSPYVTQRRTLRTWLTTGSRDAIAAAVAQRPGGGAMIVWGCAIGAALLTAYLGMRWLRRGIHEQDGDR